MSYHDPIPHRANVSTTCAECRGQIPRFTWYVYVSSRPGDELTASRYHRDCYAAKVERLASGSIRPCSRRARNEPI
jgi:hypothetical protein